MRTHKKRKYTKITQGMINKMIVLYSKGKSTIEVSKILNCSGRVVNNYVSKAGIIRTRKESNSIKWLDEKWRQNQIDKRKSKPSGAKGKTWKLNYRKYNGMIGEKNPQWRGGKTKLSIRIRGLPEYSIWRTKIFERDNWICIHCKRKRKQGDRVILQADHIIPLCKIIKENKIANINQAMGCQEIWNINNGRTLCKECHKQTETYGVNSIHASNL